MAPALSEYLPELEHLPKVNKPWRKIRLIPKKSTNEKLIICFVAADKKEDSEQKLKDLIAERNRTTDEVEIENLNFMIEETRKFIEYFKNMGEGYLEHQEYFPHSNGFISMSIQKIEDLTSEQVQLIEKQKSQFKEEHGSVENVSIGEKGWMGKMKIGETLFQNISFQELGLLVSIGAFKLSSESTKNIAIDIDNKILFGNLTENIPDNVSIEEKIENAKNIIKCIIELTDKEKTKEEKDRIETLLLRTMYYESNKLTCRKQTSKNGPARGITQVEPPTGISCLRDYVADQRPNRGFEKLRETSIKIFRVFDPGFTTWKKIKSISEAKLSDMLEKYDGLATYIARLNYKRVSSPIEDGIENQARYWMEYYNQTLTKSKEKEIEDNIKASTKELNELKGRYEKIKNESADNAAEEIKKYEEEIKKSEKEIKEKIQGKNELIKKRDRWKKNFIENAKDLEKKENKKSKS